jgi:beta-galactosidase
MARAFRFVAVIVAFVIAHCYSVFGAEGRVVIPLDGTWQIAEGAADTMPAKFDHTIPVPGLVDMAQPAFAEVGTKKSAEHRQAFWYRRQLTVDGPVPAVALLKIHKAAWGTKVWLNGKFVGEHLPCFTPALMDVKPCLKGDGQPNDLVISVGGYRDVLPKGVPSGYDAEKNWYIPGIYDSVELILTGAPYVANIQTVPDLPNKAVRIVAEIQAADENAASDVNVEIREAASGKSAGEAKSAVKAAAGKQSKIDVTIPLPNCHLWSPEDPFLYAVKVSTSSDSLATRFGMRSFRCDAKTHQTVLNGKPYYLRGTNTTVYRFFEDASRGDLPWRADWVRKLHEKYKTMHWNSMRYSIGFPPDFWYDIADEVGLLIEDEFPIFLGFKDAPEQPTVNHLIPEYTEWMRERWNHPSVVIWDAQNESLTPETGKAVAAVRDLDLSNRPWENGFGGAPTPTDCVEAHAYLFSKWCSLFSAPEAFYLRQLKNEPSTPYFMLEELRKNPATTIVNEYDWLWLNRDGSTTCLTKEVYAGLLGKNSTIEQRRMLHARYVAALTEIWRSRRTVAGVMHFCELGYSRPIDKPRPEGGATCDDFLDIHTLVMEPLFEHYVRDAFNPVGICINVWDDKLPPGPKQFPVILVNDLDKTWKSDVRFRLLRDGKTVAETTQSSEVSPAGKQTLTFAIDIPAQAGDYQVEAALIVPGGEPVCSLRDFTVAADKH